jgi:hypothetical protein
MNISLSSGFQRAPRARWVCMVPALLAYGLATAASPGTADLAQAAAGGEREPLPSKRVVAAAPAPAGRLVPGAKLADGLASVVVNVDGIASPGVLVVRDGAIFAVPPGRVAALAATPAAGTTPLPAAAGQAQTLVDAVIAGILGGAAHDAADAAFSTDNVDFAIRKGYVTTIGRVPPGIDGVTGELGSTHCDTQVQPDGTIAAAGTCPVEKR